MTCVIRSPRRHRAGRVDAEQHQVGLAALADGGAQVLGRQTRHRRVRRAGALLAAARSVSTRWSELDRAARSLRTDPAAVARDRAAPASGSALAQAAHRQQPRAVRRGAADRRLVAPCRGPEGCEVVRWLEDTRTERTRLRGRRRPRSSASPAGSASGGASAPSPESSVRPALWRIGLGLVVAEELVEQVLVEPGSVERVAAAAVRQRQHGRPPDVRAGHLVATLPGGVRDRGAGRDDVGAQPVDLEGRAHLGDLEQRRLATAAPCRRRARAASIRAVSAASSSAATGRRTRRHRRRRPSGGGRPRRAAPGRVAQRPRR